MSAAAIRRASVPLLVAAFVLLAVRTWIGLDHPLPWGAAGNPLVLRANKLSGWLTAGQVLGRWSNAAAAVDLLWELLPTLLFAAGLAGWCYTAGPSRTRPRLRIARPELLAGLLVLGIAATISRFCFGGIPHVQDSIAQQFQAQLFARGLAYGSVPPAGDQLVNEFVVIDHGRWYAQYPPVHALLLAVGHWLRVPWLVVPLIGALSGVFIYYAARAAYGRSTAVLALALFCVSPFIWFMSGEQMNHTTTLLLVSAALWMFAPALGRRLVALPLWRGGIGAVLLGLAVATRPLCGAMFALPLLLGVVSQERAIRKAGLPRGGLLLLLGAGLVLGVLPLLAFNAATTGSPLRSGYEIQWGNSGWGFGTSQWGPPHTPALGLAHAVTNWDAVGKYLFEWPVPSLLPLVGLVGLRRRTRMDGVLTGTLVSLTLGYFPYFFQDLCFGPRFLYAGVPAFILLSARGLRGWGLLVARLRRIPARQSFSVIARAVALCSAAGLAVNVPLLLREYGSTYWGTSDLLTREVREKGIHHALVLIQDFSQARRVRLHRLGVSHHAAQGAVDDLDERWIDDQVARTASLPPKERAAELERVFLEAVAHPDPAVRRTHLPWKDYLGESTGASLGFYANTPWPDQQDVIYAADLGAEENGALLRAYPDRSVWTFRYDPAVGKFHVRPMERQITSR